MDNLSNNKRLAKNTMMLYLRTLLIMLVSLYTTRIVLNSLGVEDYGVYNVVGGVVSILMSINSAMSGAASRFTSYALGQNDDNLCKRTFSTIVITHWIIAAIILLLGETIGLWLVMEKLNIPEGRETAAMICYQCSMAISTLSILNVPYNAIIIGHERMDAYAYISIIDVALKLAIALILSYSSFDRLILYSIFLVFAQGLVTLCYIIFCRKKFEESHSQLVLDRYLFKQIASFGGWTFYGQLACAGYIQGINILMNLFFGPVVNAARGIAVQVQNGAKILVNNFQVALRPQMIKTWAQGDISYMHKLVVYSSKFSFFLTALTVFPLVITICPILRIWLVDVPDHTVAFVRIILYTMLLESFNHGMIVSVHATGNIRKFQIWESSTLLSVVPICYCLLRFCHISPEQVMIVYFFVQMAAQVVRLYIVLPQIQMSLTRYILDIFPRVIIVFSLLFIPSLFIQIGSDKDILFTLVYLMVSFIFCSLIVYFIGLNKSEKKLALSFAKNIIHKTMK